MKGEISQACTQHSKVNVSNCL